MHSDAALCGVWSGSTIFANVPKNALDKIIWKLRGIKFVLFVVSLQKFLYFGKQR